MIGFNNQKYRHWVFIYLNNFLKTLIEKSQTLIFANNYIASLTTIFQCYLLTIEVKTMDNFMFSKLLNYLFPVNIEAV